MFVSKMTASLLDDLDRLEGVVERTAQIDGYDTIEWLVEVVTSRNETTKDWSIATDPRWSLAMEAVEFNRTKRALDEWDEWDESEGRTP